MRLNNTIPHWFTGGTFSNLDESSRVFYCYYFSDRERTVVLTLRDESVKRVIVTLDAKNIEIVDQIREGSSQLAGLGAHINRLEDEKDREGEVERAAGR